VTELGHESYARSNEGQEHRVNRYSTRPAASRLAAKTPFAKREKISNPTFSKAEKKEWGRTIIQSESIPPAIDARERRHAGLTPRSGARLLGLVCPDGLRRGLFSFALPGLAWGQSRVDGLNSDLADGWSLMRCSRSYFAGSQGSFED
jgi:hypothetical protein